MIELLTDPAIWASFATLTILEIVLGIDNIIFLSIVTQSLPPEKQKLARQIGLGLALIMRIVLLSMIVWIAKLTDPIFTVMEHSVSWRDLIMISGGLFLLWKGTQEIHHSLEGHEEDEAAAKKKASFAMVIGQIVILDLVFSLDSVITAVGMSDQLWVMVAAVVVAIGVMLFAAEPVSKFVHDHPTVKMLALSFILLVGLVLVAEGLHHHIERGYMYFAIAFSMGVEFLNLMAAKRKKLKREQAAKA
ncbi:MAG: TerC family protein [Micavibrio sp.]